MGFKEEGARFTSDVKFKDYALNFAAGEASRFSNFYYVTEYGIKYHTKLNCSALKRTVRRELYEEVKDRYHACPKCAGG